ncbi:dead end protein 1 [Hoplias malabaricus]|uniref:dead end protein 1 n=1 Tax=Hoplias malabaricus TaxID=27720 RepID=UPI003462F76B
MEEDVLKVLNPENLRSLLEWQRKTSITLTQVNGQRIYGGPPPGWKGPAPGLGCEVFISKIPRNVYEDRLIPLFQHVAPLYEFRLMMNFSGQNRGFAYAKYGDAESATAAIQNLDHYPLMEGVRLMVRKSTEKRQLCLGELPSGLGRDKLLVMMRLLSDEVEDVTLKTLGPKGKDVYAVVTYSSHYAASMAKKVVAEAFKRQFGVCISVQWMFSSPRTKQEERREEISLSPPVLKATPKHCLPPPRFQNTQHTQNCRRPLPHPSPSPQNTQLFSRAVGGPAPQTGKWNVPLTTKSDDLRSHDAVGQLQWLCEMHGIGVPFYDVRYHHTGKDGFLHFTYRVVFPRLLAPLCGAIQILPSSSDANMEGEVHRAMAEAVIKALCHQS